MAQYPAVIPLSSLNGSNGFQINGETEGDSSGLSVAGAGDVNGDGFADLIIGAYTASPNGAFSGASYVVFGKASGFPADFELSSLTGANGFQINGEAPYDQSGFSVAPAGDVNGDGFADLIVGAFSAGPNGTYSGASYVVFGKSSGFGPSLALSGLTGTNGFAINGEAAYDQSGFSVASAGDINGDGFDDLLIGAWLASPHGDYSGASYVVFGKGTAFAADVNLSSLTGANGFQISGEATVDYSGASVAPAGDVNGDGFADIIIGAHGASPNGTYSGASYVVFGKGTAFASNLNLSTLTGSNGFQISGEAASDHSGFSVASAGDFNGDGFADIVIGASRASPNGTYSGASYVVFGKGSGFTANLNLSSLVGANGFQINGEHAYDYSGFSVAPAGDVNGDGFDDVIIGALRYDYAGASYVVFGKGSGFADVNLAGLDGTNGFEIASEAEGELTGNSVASAGDINGDGFSDLVIGAPRAGANGDYAGASYVVFGRKPDVGIDRAGTNAAQTLAGGDFNDNLSGLGGNDRLFGNGGNDGFTGGAGNDTIDGGLGLDSAYFSGARNSYTVTRGAFTTVAGPDGTDSLTNVERLVFNNATVNLSDTSRDFNADGYGDVLFQVTDGRAAIWEMNGLAPIYGAVAGPNPGSTWHIKDGADFNGDGKADILWQTDTGRAAIWLMNGTNPTAGDLVGPNPGASWHVIGGGDFDGDGKADILWQTDTGQVAIWLMNGTTVLGGNTVGPNPGPSWHAKGTGDFNGDGKADILWQTDTGQAAIWLMNGLTILGGNVAGPNPGPTWHIKGIGDFNGDHKDDFVFQLDDGRAAIWLMNGTAPASGAVLGPNPGTTWHVRDAIDLDGDGNADILWQTDTGQVAGWLMDGTDILSGSVIGPNPGPTWHVLEGVA